MTAISSKDKTLVYDQNDINLGVINAATLGTQFFLQNSYPYLGAIVNSVLFIFRALQANQTCVTVPDSHKNFLVHPTIEILTRTHLPILHPLSAGSGLIGLVQNSFCKLKNYFQSAKKTGEQSPLAGALLHAFNIGCQTYLTFTSTQVATKSLLSWTNYFKSFFNSKTTNSIV